MEESAVSKYQEWLRVIANTRLIFNKLEELEDYLDNHSIKANGVLRSYNTEQKARAAFADLSRYVDKMTNGEVNLEQTMEQYEETSKFYQENLVRRKNHEKVVTDILTYFSYNTEKPHISKTMLSVLKRMDAQNIDISIVILLVMDAWPTFKSKEGDADAKGFVERYNAVINLLADFTNTNQYFEQIPAVTGALYERQKTRIKLLWYVNWIIATYNQLDDIYDVADLGNQKRVHLDIDGYWNECGGTGDRTDFWKIEETSVPGSYFVWKYNKKQDGTVDKVRYVMEIFDDERRLMTYFVHPKATRHLLDGIKYDAGDHCHYIMPIPDDFYNVNELMMTRKFNYKEWCEKISLTRVTDKKLIKNYDNLLKKCPIVDKYSEYEYEFYASVYAITQEALYIKDLDTEKLYKVPFGFHDSLSKMGLDSKVGILTTHKAKYLAFDELMKYIPVKKIKKSGIEVVERVE